MILIDLGFWSIHEVSSFALDIYCSYRKFPLHYFIYLTTFIFKAVDYGFEGPNFLLMILPEH